MTDTKIEWTDATWNPTAGCSKISAGCQNCYAIKDAVRLSGNDNPKISSKYAGTTKGMNWSGKINLANDDTLTQPLRWTRPRKIFVNSMSDLFHENIPDEWIDKVFAIMTLAPQHTFQILTKRPERMKSYMERFVEMPDLIGDTAAYWVDWDKMPEYEQWPPKHIWLGVSVENQKAADARIPLLLETPAAVRFLSCEPLLSNINLPIYYCCNCFKFTTTKKVNSDKDWGCAICGCYKTSGWKPSSEGGIHWVIVGGESGNKARPCSVDWIRSIVEQCKAAYVPAFVKQLGAWPFDNYECQVFPDPLQLTEKGIKIKPFLNLANKKGGDISEFPEDLRIREMPEVAK